ncbi:hypothetical protein NL676_009035 [Syzygium grande]|nr:hypothetical protein NL676_009035 [Syzygium grande]
MIRSDPDLQASVQNCTDFYPKKGNHHLHENYLNGKTKGTVGLGVKDSLMNKAVAALRSGHLSLKLEETWTDRLWHTSTARKSHSAGSLKMILIQKLSTELLEVIAKAFGAIGLCLVQHCSFFSNETHCPVISYEVPVFLGPVPRVGQGHHPVQHGQCQGGSMRDVRQGKGSNTASHLMQRPATARPEHLLATSMLGSLFRPISIVKRFTELYGDDAVIIVM